MGMLIGFLFAGVTAGALIPLVKRLQFKQIAYEDAPETHQKKTGTPTMGGIAFVVAMASLFFLVVDKHLSIPLFGLVALCGLIGFIDDLLSITQGRNRGLRARTKFLA